MEIGINKQAFRWSEAEKVMAFHEEITQDEDFLPEETRNDMVAFYAPRLLQSRILEFYATVSKNGNPYTPPTEDYDTTIDLWIEMFIAGFDACYRIEFFFNDFCALSSNNREEIRNRAYIRIYKAVD